MIQPFAVSAFLDAYSGVFNRILDESQRNGLAMLLQFILSDPDLTRDAEAAYMLATVKHECADTWRPIEERGTLDYFRRYDRAPLAQVLGNKLPGDGLLFRGRGYVQLTGRANYARFATLLNCKIVHTPADALQPGLSYAILKRGMLEGRFTGRRLGDFVNAQKTDFVQARRTVNGLDCAQKIAEYAERFLRLIEAARLEPSGSERLA